MISDTTAEPAKPVSTIRRFLNAIDNRFLAPVLVTFILLVGDLSFGILESYTLIALAIVSAIATELTLGRIVYGRWPHLVSSYITGISIGMLVRSPLAWPFIMGSVLSVMSKYVLRFKGRHVWNPSNFGLCVLLLLAPSSAAVLSIQWGNDVWPLIEIWVLGGVILWRLDRLHISATYLATFLLLSLVRSALTGNPLLAAVAPITGPMYQLFIFFMITDPATTVRRRWGQYAVVVGIAVVEMLLRLGGVIYAPLYALFLAGPPAIMFERWWDDRAARVLHSAERPGTKAT